MAGRRWDDRWARYPASVPLPAEGGIATSKQRGAMAATWWSRRFVQVLESYGLGARMQRGRRYARSGQVLGVQVKPGTVAAQVQGSRRTPYLVTVTMATPSEAQWRRILGAMGAKVGFVAHLLAGEVPVELEEVFASVGVALFPESWGDLRADCSCPDWENPCKHIAAVLYVLADQLDSEPWLVLAMRGRDRRELLDALTGTGGSAPEPVSDVAPWWPFGPGPLPLLPEPPGEVGLGAAPSERPDAVLDSLQPLAVEIGPRPVVDLLRALYPIVTQGEP
jgi:uncharacterized Zn finger protein